MFRFLCKKLVQDRTKDSTISHICFCFLQTQSLKSDSDSTKKKSLTVSYLINSCGFSLESAISASKKICIKTTKRPDSVLELLKTHGFTKTHITKLVTKYPQLLLANPHTLEPKFEYFDSLGISRPDLAKILSTDRGILLSSLTDRIIPNFDFLRSFVHTNENLIAIFKHSTRVATCNSHKVMVPNITTLRAHGVSDSNISKFIMIQPRALMQNNNRFNEVVELVKEMGFDPTRCLFVIAVGVLLGLSKLNWERKMEVLKSFGWSEDDGISAFRLQPHSFLTSEEKIRKLMDFFVNKLGLKPSDIARYPNLLLISLEKRIIPRCSVLQVLKLKGLIKKEVNVPSVLNLSKKRFEKTFVIKYQVTDPEVVEAYQGTMVSPGLDIGFTDVHGIMKP